VALPVIELFNISASSAGSIVRTQVERHDAADAGVIPVVLPATIAAYSVIGERDQGTLEPLLTTPISPRGVPLGQVAGRGRFPRSAWPYVFFLVLVIAVRLASPSVVVHAVWNRHGSWPRSSSPTAGRAWSVWVGTAISARSSDVRVAQQLGTLASLPALILPLLMALQVFKPHCGPTAIVLALTLAVIDVAAPASGLTHVRSVSA